METENKYRRETKFFCTFCKVFVQNNKISKTTHEQGPGHKNAVGRFLRLVHKTKDRNEREKVENGKMLAKVEMAANKNLGTSWKNGSVSNKVGTGKVNLDLYGYGVTENSTADSNILPSTAFVFNPAEFHATQAFKDANVPTIGVGTIGEWEAYTEPVMTETQSGDDGLVLPVKRGHADAFLDEDEGVTKEDVVGFKIKEKKMLALDFPDDDRADDNDEIGFKKRKGKSGNTRKRL